MPVPKGWGASIKRVMAHVKAKPADVNMLPWIEKIGAEDEEVRYASAIVQAEGATDSGFSLTLTTCRRIVYGYCDRIATLRKHEREYEVDTATSAYLLERVIGRIPGFSSSKGELQSTGSKATRNLDRGPCDSHMSGQKLDLRLYLAETTEEFEPLVHLRSGGLPAAGFRKGWTDRRDLALCLRDILHSFGVSVAGVPAQCFSQLYVLGSHAWGES